MSDIQTCLASFAVASGAQSENTAETIDRTLETFLADTPDDRVQATMALKAAFEAMMLNGRMAAYISSRIDQALTSQLSPEAGGVLGDHRQPRSE